MRRRSILPVFVFLALLLSGCAGNPSYDPWLVPRDSFLARTRAIALSPIQVPEDLEEPGPVEAMFDSLIANALRAAGFSAILLSAIANSQMPAGAAEGFSLDVQIESVDGGVVYTNRGGIELWAKPSGDGSRLNWVPRERLFADRKRCEKAVRIALEPVLKREGSVAR